MGSRKPYWTKSLRRNPVPALLAGGNEAVAYFARRDLLGAPVGRVESLWRSTPAQAILRRQQPDGSWRYPGGRPGLRSREDYDQLETYRRVGHLVEKYGMMRASPVLAGAAERLYRAQSREGDFRGIYGRQYTPNYTGGILELLIKAGFAEDARTERGLRWLLAVRQEDGGWALPFRIAGSKLTDALMRTEPLRGDPSSPSSHLVTGVVLRAFAAHPRYRRRAEVLRAGEILRSGLFRKDAYPDRGTPEYWTRFAFPFWFTDLLSALDSLSLLGFTADDPQIRLGLRWLAGRQGRDGLWDVKLLKTRDKDLRLWIGLAASRIFRRFHER